MTHTYMVRWNSYSGAGGFGSVEAAQQYIACVCMVIAPDIIYTIEREV